MIVTGIKQVMDLFSKKQIQDPSPCVLVGYTAKYALFVHENMQPKTLGMGVRRPSGLGMFWGPSQYGPKFLEGPAREFAKEVVDIVTTAFAKGTSLTKSLLLGGLKIQRESMKVVPVEYGALRASAFTREDDGA